MATTGMRRFNHDTEKTLKLKESDPDLFLRALKVFFVYLQNVVPMHRTCHVVDESILDRQCFDCKILESDKRHYGWRKQVDLFALVSFYNSKIRQAKKGWSATEAEKKMKEDVDVMIREFEEKIERKEKERVTKERDRQRDKKKREEEKEKRGKKRKRENEERVKRGKKRKRVKAAQRVIRNILSGMTKKVEKEVETEKKKKKREEEKAQRVSKRERLMKIYAVTLLYNETKFPGRGYHHFKDDRYLGVKVAVNRLLRRYWNEKTGYETINMVPYHHPKKFRPGTATHNLLLEEFKRMERHHRDYCDLMFDFPLKKDNCFRSDKYWWPIIQSKVHPYINWC